ISVGVSAAEMTALEVMQSVDTRYDGDTVRAEYTMVLIDRRDRQRTRNLNIYSKDYGVDTRTLSQFESPVDIRGTSYLNFDWDDPDRDDDSWLYLPALQRVKRIASSDTSDSFLGSDFTYADINGIEIDWFDYRFVNESEMVDGFDTWVIEATPKPEFKDKAEDATGYSKLQSWIRKDNFVQVRGQAWELRGNRIKYFTSSDIEEIDGIWTVQRLQAVTTRSGRQEHASVLQLNGVEYNENVDDEMFSTEYMQRGLD
ncbi:MAG: outer membrane lipoprotein-sorting protein, partial [Pseudomonadales bacterium]|nr:outer membrane lipoprotein-sorting protein [Pseudomonadales bacterium]